MLVPERHCQHDHRHALVRPQVLRTGRMSRVRCAIYTRKSSEEGLDQEFNSLDAQYEACKAYIASQKHEGWRLNRERYDDGGFSGGTMERPGLKALLADVALGQDRRDRHLQDRPPDPQPRRLRHDRRAAGEARCQLRQRHPVVQHQDQHGPADAPCAAVVRAVRARGRRRAGARQDRGVEGQGHVDGRHRPAWLRRRSTRSWSSTRPRPTRCAPSLRRSFGSSRSKARCAGHGARG